MVGKMRLPVVFVTMATVLAIVLPVGTALAQQANPARVLPDSVQRGATFDVTVTFVSFADNFNCISVVDRAPDGWTVIVDETWCTPKADAVQATGKQAVISWTGAFSNGTAFAAVYKVIVPHDAELGAHTFAGSLRYYLGGGGPYSESITGNCQVEVILPDISFSPTNFSFNATEGEANPPSQMLDIWNLKQETVNWYIYDDADWLSENPTGGSLVANEHDCVEVSVEIAGLAAGMYNADISIETINATWRIPVTLEIKETIVIDVTRWIDETLRLPNELYPGDIFDIIVNWTSPLNNFAAVGFTDIAPVGFEVGVNATWCSPNADEIKGTGNKAEISWFGPYDKGTDFTAWYKVTVPTTAAPGSHFFPYNDCPNGSLGYYFGEDGPYTSCIMGDYEVVVTVPGDVAGETRDVNTNPLAEVNVSLYKETAGALGSGISTPNFTIMVNETGEYWLLATKARYYEINITDMPMLPPLYIDLSTPELLAEGYVFDFEGNYGLVPRACNRSYAQKSMNLWLFPPPAHPGWGIEEWKVMDSIHSWQYPA